jgi:hypothetical protein
MRKILLLIVLSTFIQTTYAAYNDTLVKKNTKFENAKRQFATIDAKIALKDALNAKGKRTSFKSFSEASTKTDSLKNTLNDLFTNENLKFVEKISGYALVELPVGLKGHTKDGFQAELVIVKAKVTEQYLELTAFARLQTQFNGVHLYFAAEGLKLSHDGGVIGDWKLHLLGKTSLPQFGGKMLFTIIGSDIDKPTGGFTENSFIEFDCDGFKSFAFKSDIRLARSIVIPVGADGKRIEYDKDLAQDGYRAVGNSNYVGAKLDIKSTGWDDLLIQVSLPSFEIKNLQNWTFKLENAVFDMSDIKNSPDVQFPEIYTNNQLFPGGNKNAWRGFYAKEVKVSLPPEFKNNNSARRTEFVSQNLLLDNLGVSGRFKGYNVLDKGNATGWQFRVDTLDVKIAVNHLTHGRFIGGIKPATMSYLSFKGIITPEKYLMTVSVDSADMKMFKGKLVFERNSWIKMEVDKTTEKFKAEANLNGFLNIVGNTEDEPLQDGKKTDKFVDFKGIVFQNLRIKSYAQPYIQADYFGYPGEAKLGNFPVSFQNIHLIAPPLSPETLGIGFTIKVDLMENSGIYADGSLEILGKFENSEFQSYKFDKVKVNAITVDVEKSSFHLFGKINFFDNDAIYGKGFQGELDIELKNLNVQGKAKALFANKDFRFWFADFQINNNSSGSSKFKIERIEGGLSYRMKRTDGNMAWAYNSAVYQPSISAGLGLRAGAKATFGSGTTFKAKVFVELEFNSSGGLNRLYFLGEGAMMAGDSDTQGTLSSSWATYDQLYASAEGAELKGYLAQGNLLKISKRAHPISEIAKDGKVGVFVSIERDFAKNTFDGLFELYMNLQGIKGSGPNNLLGTVHMYSSPTKSYLHIGTPLNKCGAIFKMGVYDLNVQAYFMSGDDLPTQQVPDARVIQILGPSIINDNRNLSLLESGRGFAFGLNFNVQLNYDLGFFYAFIEAGGGFDITHAKYEGVSCAGRNGPVGNDGWYSMGQVYAYLYGEFGIRVDLGWFGDLEIPILQAGVAVLLKGEFPNPTHMEGYVGVSYSVLGGLVSGRVRFKVEMGEKCDFIGMSNAVGVKVISDVSPRENETVDCFKIPQVAFNYPVDQAFSIEDRNGNRKSVRIKLKSLILQADGQNITGTLQWKDNNRKVNFVSDDILPPLKTINGKVIVNFEENTGGNWVAMTENGQASAETKDFSFKTTSAPDYIPIDNIKYAYPIPNGNNFYPEEHKNAYIKLKQGQDYLFTGANATWTIKGEMYEATQRKSQTTLAYDSAANKISFPYDFLTTQKNAKMRLIAYAPGTDPTLAQVSTLGNVNTNTGAIDTTNNPNTTINTTTVNNVSATASNQTNVAKSLLEYNFVTSKHTTFANKINSLNRTGNIFEIIYADTHALHYLTNSYEVFNEAELYGNQYTDAKPMIKLEAVLDDAYYTQTIYPLIYQNYPLDGNITITNRNVSLLGFPPAKSIDIPAYYQAYLQNQPNSNLVNGRLPFRYNMPYTFKKDHTDLRYQVVNRYLSTPVNWEKYQQYQYLIDSSFPSIPIGNYKVKITYSLNTGEFSSFAERLYNRNY